MVTTRAYEAPEPVVGVEQTNASGYQRALRLGMRHDAAVLAAEHPEYLAYYKFVHPMDFRVAYASRPGLHATLTNLGYDVSGIEEPERAEAGEDIRPRRGW